MLTLLKLMIKYMYNFNRRGEIIGGNNRKINYGNVCRRIQKTSTKAKW